MKTIQDSKQGSVEHRDLQLEKLGIRQIHERIEVSPIITDPGTMGLDVENGTPKSYICTINFQDMPIKPVDIG